MPFAFASTAMAQDQSQQPSPLKPMDQPGQQQYFLPEGFITATGRPEPISRLVGTVQVIHQDRIAKSTARSVTELLNENAVGFMSEWTPGQTSINIRGARDRGPGPRLQEPGAGADQRPSRRHRQHLQAVERRHRAHRDRARALVGDLRQPEHGRRHQHHPEDRPDGAGQRRAGRCGLVEPARGQGRERRPLQGLRLVRRRRGQHARQLRHLGRRAGAQHGVDALRRYRRLRLPDRRDQPRRGHGALRRHLQRRLPRLERQPVRLRHALQLLVRHELPRQDARRAGQRLLPGLLRHRRRRPQQSLAAQRAQCRRRAHHDGSQPPPARHPRHALPAALQAVLRQRAAVRPRLGAELAALRPLSRSAARR